MKLTKFQDLSLKEKIEVLRWRNAESIRKWMFNHNVRSLQEHLKFIETLSFDNEKIYIKVDDIGVINFKKRGDHIEIGLHKNPSMNGVGKKLLATAIEFASDVLQAKKIIINVLTYNKRALHLYKEFGFIERDISGDIITMELNDENR